jgi:hypothetical protein
MRAKWTKQLSRVRGSLYNQALSDGLTYTLVRVYVFFVSAATLTSER